MGLAFLSAALKQKGHHVFIIDNYLEPSPFLEKDFLQKNHIELVGIQTNTICHRDTLRILYLIQGSREQGKWKGRIMVGGPHASVCQETIPEFVDHIVQGEGEKAVLDITEGHAEDRIIRYPPITDLDELPRPDWESFIHLPYDWSVECLKETPVFPLNTSRGCPFRCTFCSVGSIWGKRYHSFSPERIIDDIQYLVKTYNARGIYFREDNFTFEKERVVQFCNLLLQKKIGIKWLCESRVNNLDHEILSLMKRAGCQWIYLGLESGSQKMLDLMQKDITVEQVIKVLESCKSIGIHTYGSFITGVPGEMEEDRRATQKLIRKNLLSSAAINVFVGIPISRLYQDILKSGKYEYMDDRGMLYLKSHDRLVEEYYGGDTITKTPSRPLEDQLDYSDKKILIGEKYNLLSGLVPRFKAKDFIAHHRFLDGILKPGQKVLDAGSLAGISSFRMAECGANVTALIESEEELSFAIERFGKEGIEFLKWKPPNLDFEENSFDVITAFDLIEQMPVGEANVFIEKCQALLKPGGRMVGTVHILPELFYKTKYLRPFEHEATDYSPARIDQLLRSHFHQVKYHYLGSFLTFVASKPPAKEQKKEIDKSLNRMGYVNNFLFPLAKDLIYYKRPHKARKLILHSGWRSLLNHRMLTLYLLSFLPRSALYRLQQSPAIRALWKKITP